MRVSSILDDLVKEYSGKVRVVYKNLIVHPQVRDAHLAGCAASKQGKFNEYKRDVWEKAYAKRDFSKDNLVKIAGDLGLNTDKFKTDMEGDDCKSRIDGDMAELGKFHVNGTPAFFINGQHIGGGIPKEAFKQIIDQKLQVAEAAKVPGAQYYQKEIMDKGLKEYKAAPAEGGGGGGQ
jgi:predicted DsbA family dithiol-disulfide isomerase